MEGQLEYDANNSSLYMCVAVSGVAKPSKRINGIYGQQENKSQV
jgi:hypothetical protein